MDKDIRCTFYRDEKTLLSFLFPTKFDNYNVYMRLCFYLKDVRRKVKLISHLRLHLMLLLFAVETASCPVEQLRRNIIAGLLSDPATPATME